MPLIELQRYSNENFSGKTLSHSMHLMSSEYYNCRFDNSNMSSVVFEKAHFIKCDFSDCDASSSRFKSCTFKDCLFKNASFAHALFIECEIIQNDPNLKEAFLNTGLGNVTFSGGMTAPSRIAGVHFRNNSFRNAIFEGVELRNVYFEGTPFEKVAFKNCDFDVFDLTFGTVKGLSFSNTSIERFQTTAEKAFSIIGLFEVLKGSDFTVYAETPEGEEQAFGDMADVCRILASGLSNLAQAGALYEFLNSICFLSKAVAAKKSPTRSMLPEVLSGKNHPQLSGQLYHDIENALNWFVTHNSHARDMVSMNSVNYALDVILAEKLVTAKIYNQFVSLAQFSLHLHRHPQVSAEVFWKLSILESSESDTHFTLTVTDRSVQGIDYHSSAQLALCLDTFMMVAGFKTYRVLSRSEGSLVEKIVLSKLDLITSFKQLATILLICNFSLDVDLPQFGVHFSFNGEVATASDQTPIKTRVSKKDADIVSSACESLDFNADLPPSLLETLLKACQENKKRLHPMISRSVDLSLKHSVVKELKSGQSNKAFLLPQPIALEHKALKS